LKRLTTIVNKDLRDIFQVESHEQPMMLIKKRDKVLISLSSWGHNGRVWTKHLFDYLQMRYGLWIDQIDPLEETVVLATFKLIESQVSEMEWMILRHIAKNRADDLG